MGAVGAVTRGAVSRLRSWLVPAAERRHAARRRLAGVGRDALVAGVLLVLALVVVGGAAYALAVAVSNGGIPGLVLGWTAAFAFAVSLPLLATKAATAVYGRVGA